MLFPPSGPRNLSHTSEAPPPWHVAGPSLSPPPRISPSPLSPAPTPTGRAGYRADAARDGVKLQPGQVPAGRKGSVRRTRESRDFGTFGRMLWGRKGQSGRLSPNCSVLTLLPLGSLVGLCRLGGLISAVPGRDTRLGGQLKGSGRDHFFDFSGCSEGRNLPGPMTPPPPLPVLIYVD